MINLFGCLLVGDVGGHVGCVGRFAQQRVLSPLVPTHVGVAPVACAVVEQREVVVDVSLGHLFEGGEGAEAVDLAVQRRLLVGELGHHLIVLLLVGDGLRGKGFRFGVDGFRDLQRLELCLEVGDKILFFNELAKIEV